MTRFIAAQLLIVWMSLVAAISSSQAASPSAAIGEKPALGGIEVRGNRRVEADAIRNAMASRVGVPFNITRAEEDLKALWKLGFFSDVQILLDEDGPAPQLIVVVEEKPAIRKVEVRGNEELSDEDLKEIVTLKPFTILNMESVRQVARRLQEKYVEKGYYLAEVTPKIESASPSEVDVFFDVNEHAKVQIRSIDFIGNEKVSSDELRDVMLSKEGNLLSFLTSAGTFREDMLQHDVMMIQSAYLDRGFINVRVSSPRVSISADRRFINISIPITEGEQYSLGTVDFAGDLLKPPEELARVLTMERGEVFNRSQLQRDIQALTDVYQEDGYAYANLSPLTSIDPTTRVVDLTFDIKKGDRVTVERINIVGNHTTRDKVIRRELRVYEGELFRGTGMRVSKNRVMALGYFETVEVIHKRGSKPDTVVVTVLVKEKPTGTFQVGFGFSSFESFLFTAQISKDNLFGWGVSTSLAAQISSVRSLVQLSYYDPHFLDSNWIFAFNFYRQQLDYYGFVRGSVGGDITWGYHLMPDLMLLLAYVPEYVTVEPSGGTADLLLANRFRNGFSSGLRLTLIYDKRDNRLFPKRGHYESASVEHSPEWLGASFIYTRYSGNVRLYFPILKGQLVFKVQGALGYIQGDDIPISELYYLGGISNVRGYALRSISPTVRVGTEGLPDASLSEFTVGGDKQAYFNFELEFPILDSVGIRGVAFYDMGNVYGVDETIFSPKGKLPLGMRHSVGFGVRWISPIGPLRFEWGFPLTRRSTDDSYQFEFTIGNSF
ncbi:MAG: outer membrane protein assembly factor BamA [Myxococcales bacterium]|jgi:outer membrane protein insertion porin family|nr:outer membrane protein assembly factor BamA [Myxococcales bacterium]